MATKNNPTQLLDTPVLPSSCYTSQEFYQREMEMIFSRTWVLVGREDQVAKSGDFFTCTVAGEPILVVRGRDEKLRAFYNVCRHRGTQVMAGEGSCKAFSCPYHGWTYSIEGELVETPNFQGPPSFNKSEHGLRPIQVDMWEGLIFVNLDADAMPLLTYLGDLPERVKPWRLGELKWVKRGPYKVACNWKITMENYNEAFHLPYVHSTSYTFAPLQSWTFEEAGGPYSSLWSSGTDRATLVSYSYLGRGRQRPLISGLDERYHRRLCDFEVFPNFMLNFSPDHVVVFTVVPTGPESTVISADYYFPEPDREGFDASDVYEVWDTINSQDVKICERQQAGVRSKSYQTIPLDPVVEQGTREFRSKVRDWVEGPNSKA